MDKYSSLTCIKGIGEKTEKNFNKLEIFTVGDLLEYYPRTYDRYGDIVRIKDLSVGEVAVISVTLCKKPVLKRFSGKSITIALVEDNTGRLELTWFNAPYISQSFVVRGQYIFRGKVDFKAGKRVMRQPQVITLKDYNRDKYKLLPIYPLTAGVTNNAVKKAVKAVLSDFSFEDEYFKDSFLKKNALISRKKAITDIHEPSDSASCEAARRRLVFDELYEFLKGVEKLKLKRTRYISYYIWKKSEMAQRLMDSLDFELTEGQIDAYRTIKEDMASGNCMNRLVQGDVGCGKTIVALLAMLIAVEAGSQAAIMVPTQVLATQHFESIREALLKAGLTDVNVVLMDGSMKKKDREETLALIKTKEAQIIVGTHALIQEGVEFFDLGLVITDEQHRFGVRQRDELANKGNRPHMLVMSATPIPRTLSLLLYGDLDISVIKTLPLNRKPIKNCVVGISYRPSAYKFMQKEIEAGHQVYVICPMVDESESIEAENCLDYVESLKEVFSKSVNIDYVHGRMTGAEKDERLTGFAEGNIDILVSTTVIEVGINVPNATVMLIENAERFGLATLHQLRGRVGRSDLQSYCIFMMGHETEKAKERLGVINSSNDGFFIANEDLKLRGPGDVLGVRQSGEMEFKLANIYRDEELLKIAHEVVINPEIYSKIQVKDLR